MKKGFERERQFKNEMRERRTQDTNDNWLNWILVVMATFCAIAFLVNTICEVTK